jgi:1,4-dihydroxy-2-naphthoate octaprenyltransferase
VKNNPWIMAARPSTLWAAIAPVVVAASLAIHEDAFRPDVLVVTMLAAVAIQIGVNFANDLADAARGADTETRIGPTRAVAAGLITPRQMRNGMIAAFGFAALGGLYLTFVAGWVVIAIGVASIVAALGYTNGPVPYGYYGLGELFVFVFFGLVATVGARYVYDQSAPLDAWICGVVMGLFAAAILIANNLRDIDTDRAAGKRTLAVILGRNATRTMYALTILGAFGMIALGAAATWLPAGTMIAYIASPLALPLFRIVGTQTEGPPLIRALKGTARLQVLVAALMSVGILLS